MGRGHDGTRYRTFNTLKWRAPWWTSGCPEKRGAVNITRPFQTQPYLTWFNSTRSSNSIVCCSATFFLWFLTFVAPFPPSSPVPSPGIFSRLISCLPNSPEFYSGCSIAFIYLFVGLHSILILVFFQFPVIRWAKAGQSSEGLTDHNLQNTMPGTVADGPTVAMSCMTSRQIRWY